VAQQTLSTTYKIDELAQLAGVPSRTIRFYNTQGLLPAPIMRGRVAYYTHDHLLILSIIKELKEQQNLPLDVVKQLLEIRARGGDVRMNLALKQRLLRPFSPDGQQIQLSKEALMQQTGATEAQIDELTRQGLLFPTHRDGEMIFSADDVLLLQLYQHLEELGLPIALPALIRFQLRQLVRSEIAAFEQYVRSGWRQESMPSEQQLEQFEAMFTLTDTLISLLHRKLLERM
jgi:DNA-binding transcriptional MerR regulator